MVECRNNGLSVTRWCTEDDIKPTTYLKNFFVAMIDQQRQKLEESQEAEWRFAELPAPSVQGSLVATVRVDEAPLDMYSGASAEAVTALGKTLSMLTDSSGADCVYPPAATRICAKRSPAFRAGSAEV